AAPSGFRTRARAESSCFYLETRNGRPRESGGPVSLSKNAWVPACAGTTIKLFALGADLLDLGAELLEHLAGVEAVLVARLLDPVVDDRLRALVHLGDELRIGLRDLDVRLLQRLDAFLVGLVPRLAVRARRVLIGDLVDDRLVLLRDLVPLVLVHEEAERRAVHAA